MNSLNRVKIEHSLIPIPSVYLIYKDCERFLIMLRTHELKFT